MTKDINKKVFTESTELKLDIFRKCFREWFPVFLNDRFIKRLYVYDLFAGSGYDTEGNPGSPIILLEEARGDKRQYCRQIVDGNTPKVYFGLNEYKSEKEQELEKSISSSLNVCKKNCNINYYCPFQIGRTIFCGHEDFTNLKSNPKFQKVLNDRDAAKFILLDQYGFKHIDDNVFKQLISYPKTDFVFFIASMHLKRFYEIPCIHKYFSDHKIEFSPNKPNNCHRDIANYYRSLVPKEQEYYIHQFTIKYRSNYYGLIFGTGHSYGMEKFLKVCWEADSNSGESNFNIDNDFEKGNLFYNPNSSNRKEEVKEIIKQKIFDGYITDNVSGMKYVMQMGCQPSLFIEVIDGLLKNSKITIIDGKYNKRHSRIHRLEKDGYKYTLQVKK